MMAHKSSNGLWVVKRGEGQWLAWRDWLKAELGRRFFPQYMTLPIEWPPETVQAAAAVADHFRDARERARKDKDWPRRKTPEANIPIVPTPWVRWSQFEIDERVRSFADAESSAPIVRSQEDIDRLLRSVGRMPGHLKTPRIEDRGRELLDDGFKMPEPRDDIAAIRAAAIKRRLRDAGMSE